MLHYGDLCDASSVNRLLRAIRPDEIYNLAAQSHVKVSFEIPEYTGDVDGLGTLRILEGIRDSGLNPRIYQAGSSEMFGKVSEIPQTETTPFYPRSPYAAAKVYAHWLAVNYREAYGMFVCNGILFNHESPRRGENFVTRKITLGVAAIKLGLQKKLCAGQSRSQARLGLRRRLRRGHVADAAAGQAGRLRDRHRRDAFGAASSARRPSPTSASTTEQYVAVDPLYFRPTEVDLLVGDATKAREALGWRPCTSFQELVRTMVDSDIELLKRKHQL